MDKNVLKGVGNILGAVSSLAGAGSVLLVGDKPDFATAWDDVVAARKSFVLGLGQLGVAQVLVKAVSDEQELQNKNVVAEH